MTDLYTVLCLRGGDTKEAHDNLVQGEEMAIPSADGSGEFQTAARPYILY